MRSAGTHERTGPRADGVEGRWLEAGRAGQGSHPAEPRPRLLRARDGLGDHPRRDRALRNRMLRRRIGVNVVLVVVLSSAVSAVIGVFGILVAQRERGR